MIGLGTWVATINMLIYKGDITVVIGEKDGQYDIDFQLPEKFKSMDIQIRTFDIVAEGNTIKGKGEVSKFPGKELEAEVTFDGDKMSGVLRIPFLKRTIDIKNGHKIA